MVFLFILSIVFFILFLQHLNLLTVKTNTIVFAWIGIHREKNKWVSIRGELLSETGYNINEANGAIPDEATEDDCIVFRSYSFVGSLHVEKCSGLKIKTFICEK